MSILPEKQRACLKQDPIARAILPLRRRGMLPPSSMKIKRNPLCKAAYRLLTGRTAPPHDGATEVRELTLL